jgi:hypothetical protein
MGKSVREDDDWFPFHFVEGDERRFFLKELSTPRDLGKAYPLP